MATEEISASQPSSGEEAAQSLAGQPGESQKTETGQLEEKANLEKSKEADPNIPSDPEQLKVSYKEMLKKIGQQGNELGDLRKLKSEIEALKNDPNFMKAYREYVNGQAESPPPESEEDEFFEPPTKRSEFESLVEKVIEKRLERDPNYQVSREVRLDKEYSRLEKDRGFTDIRQKEAEMTRLYNQWGRPPQVTIEDLYLRVKADELHQSQASSQAQEKARAEALANKQRASTQGPGMTTVKTDIKVKTVEDAGRKALADLGIVLKS